MMRSSNSPSDPRPAHTGLSARPRVSSAPRPALRVRTGRNYQIKFNVDLGQRNAMMRLGPLTPLVRYFRRTDALTVLPSLRTDVIHSVNAVPLFTRKPYIITFEDYLPRTPEDRPAPHLEAWLRRRLL